MAERLAILTVLVVVLGVAGPVKAEEPTALRLEDCELRAAAGNPSVRAARQSLEMARAKADERGWAWFPDFDLLTYATVAPGSSSDEGEEEGHWCDNWGAYFRLELKGEMPLYTFGALSARREEALRRVDAAQSRVAHEIQKVTYEVRRAWHDYTLACADEETTSLGLERLGIVQVRLDELDDEDDPDLDPIDRLRVRVRRSELTVLHREALRDRALALSRLRSLMGLAPDEPLSLVPCPLEPAIGLLAPLAEYEILARAFNPSLRAGRHEKLADRERLRARERSLWPELFLGTRFRYGYRGASEPELSPFASDRSNSWDFAVLFGVRVPLDIPQRLAKRDIAAAQLSYRDRRQHGDEQEVDLRVARRYGVVEDILTRLPSLRDAARAARSWYDARESVFDIGMATVSEVLKALSAAVDRQRILSRALRDLNVAVAALSRDVGVDIALLDVDAEGAKLPSGFSLPEGGLPPGLRERLLRYRKAETKP